MIALAGSVLLASLVGSPHCAGMCGGIAAFCGGAGSCGGRASAMATAAYHGSRAMSYAAVGALAGAFGSLLDAGGTLVGLQRAAAVAAGVAVALVGVSLLCAAGGFDAGRLGLPAWAKRALAAVHRSAAAMPPVRRGVVIGLATPLLPCGWLWAFALVAAGTGSPLAGAVVMVAFWAGTVPVLAVVGAGIAALGATRRRWLAALAGVAMIAVGVHTAGMRAGRAAAVAESLSARGDGGSPTMQTSSSAPAPACCADGSGALRDLPPRPACCEGDVK